MNKVINAIFDIIGIEVGISRIITSYFYMETILDNKMERINVTGNTYWIDNEHFYTQNYSDFGYVYDIYNIKGNIIKHMYKDILLDYLVMEKNDKFIVLDNALILCAKNKVMKYNNNDNDNNKYTTCFEFNEKVDVYYAKTLNEYIIIKQFSISKYNCDTYKLITEKKSEILIIYHVVTDNNIIYSDDKNVYIMDQKKFSIMHTFVNNMIICNLYYDYYTDNVFLCECANAFAIYNIHNGFIGECNYTKLYNSGYTHCQYHTTHPAYILAYNYISTGLNVAIYNTYTKKHVRTFDCDSTSIKLSPNTRYAIIGNNIGKTYILT